MKIYTKTGDTGSTSLLGGTRVPKSHERIEAYGTVDELNAYLGLLGDMEAVEPYRHVLSGVQKNLFIIGSILACDTDPGKYKIPSLNATEVSRLENEIDRIDQAVPALKNFILPGGHQAVSFCHIARCVCRRAERRVTALTTGEIIPAVIIVYLNRLSDYLFMLARQMSTDLKIPEIPWKGSE